MVSTASPVRSEVQASVVQASPSSIHAMCLIKNEADIIVETLQAASTWCDFIYVYDNGSTDGTWERVLNLSKVNSQIVTYKTDPTPFTDSLRGELFYRYRANFREGDWLCRLDADEIYIDNPRIFLAKVPPQYRVVWAAMFQYAFTDKDLELYDRDPSLYSEDVPVEQRLRYYKNDNSEIRFFRYLKHLEYKPGGRSGWPTGIGDPYPVRIWYKHFVTRSPEQIQKRLDTRRETVYRGKLGLLGGYGWFRHELPYVDRSWTERVAKASQLDYDAFDGKYVVNEGLMRPIRRPTLTTRVKRGLKRLGIGSTFRG